MKTDTVFTCIADPNKKFLDQSARLLMSLRWFGGSMAQARFVLGCTGPLPKEADRFFESYGAEIVAIERYHATYGPGNKIALLRSAALAGHDVVALLDCDTIIVQDPSPWLDVRGAALKTADLPTVTQPQLDALFRFYGRTSSEPQFTHELTGDPCIAYCNSGVLIVRESHRDSLADSWNSWCQKLLEAPAELDFPRYHVDQAGLALALEDTGVPYEPLPTEMNMPTHLDESAYPQGWHQRDPVIIHYHWLVHPTGYLKSPNLRQTARRVESFNARLRAEGHVAAPAAMEPASLWRREELPASSSPQRPKIVVGSGWWCSDAPHDWSTGSPATRSASFFDLWYRQVIRCLDPHRIVVTDSASPVKPDYRSYGPVEWIELDKNYGHPNDVRVGKVKTKFSGFTRSVINGAMYALCCDADFYVYVEQDCLLFGDQILQQAIGDSDADIFLGQHTKNGKGLSGQVAAPMLQQSLIIVRRSGLERFIEGVVCAPWTDGEVSPEIIMERRLPPFDVLRIPFGRTRPIDFGRSHFYVQHLDDEELNRFLDRVEGELGYQSGFVYTVKPRDQ